MTESPFDKNTEIAQMKENLADRTYAIGIKNILWPAIGAGIGAIAGGVIGSSTIDQAALQRQLEHTAFLTRMGMATAPVVEHTLAGAGATLGGMGGMFAGSGAAILSTLKDQTKLNIDRENLESRMQAQNWHDVYGSAPLPTQALAGLPNRNSQSRS